MRFYTHTHWIADEYIFVILHPLNKYFLPAAY